MAFRRGNKLFWGLFVVGGDASESRNETRGFLQVRRRSLRVAVFSLLWVLGLIVICAGGFYWRLTQGPLSLAFMGDSIERAINNQLPGFRIALGETELELDAETRTPNVRVKNIVLHDANGEVIASAPKAGVTLDKANLLQGVVGIQNLDLIGPRINIRRNLDGSLQLGIANDLAATDQPIVLEAEPQDTDASAKSSLGGDTPPAQTQLISGSKILELLDAGGVTGTLSKLEEVRLSRGALQFYDEANNATWIAPRAELAFRRTPSGFVVATKADVTSSGEPWKVEASVTFRKLEKNFTANVVVDNLVPATVADQVYALSQFARLNTPLSGNFQLEAREDGLLTKLEGQVFAAAGQVNLPEYLANPILIDEGSIRVRQLGSGKPFEILESSILVGGSRADLKGTVTPQAAEDGRIVSYAVDLGASNVSVDAQGTIKNPVFVDRVGLKGSFGVDEQRVDIEDLVVMAGNTGIRLRAEITAGDASPGIKAAGRLKDVNADLLKKLWPPVLAPKTRAWINENVEAGVIGDGAFDVNYPPDALARSQREKVLPPDAVNLTFNMRDVKTRYFKSLPVLQGALGNAALKDAKFSLNIDKGFVVLPSGKRLDLAEGQFGASDLLAVEVPGTFRFDIQGEIGELLEFASQPDLNLVKEDLSKFPKMAGKARAIVGLNLPLVKGVQRNRVTVTQEVSLSDAAVSNIFPDVDLTDGKFGIDVGKDLIVVSGPAKLNGISAKIDWRKPRDGGEAKIALETTLTESMRSKLGIKLGSYMTGDVPVKLDIQGGPKEGRRVGVEADLSGVSMKAAAAGWSRPAMRGTRSTFTFVDDPKSGRRIEDLAIDGSGLRIRGNLSLTSANALRVIDLDEVSLSEDDRFAIRMAPGDGVTKLSVTGNSFDARPYIKNLISPAKPGAATSEGPKGGDFVITAKFKTVTAFRGEVVRNVTANFTSAAGKIVEAEMRGFFDNGFPITLKLKPIAGGREMRVDSTDGGSTLRAANFYGKVAGGELEFFAQMANSVGSPIRNGGLTLRNFAVRNEAALTELDSKGRPKKTGKRLDGVTFKRLELPFTSDAEVVRLCKVSLRGPEIGMTASGLIRKRDSRIDITGAYFPAHGLNRAIGEIPLFGEILAGGKGEGVLGITYAMGGTISKPSFQINPLSFLLPGILRKLTEYEQTACRSSSKRAAN
jgi:hypothetical protein